MSGGTHLHAGEDQKAGRPLIADSSGMPIDKLSF